MIIDLGEGLTFRALDLQIFDIRREVLDASFLHKKEVWTADIRAGDRNTGKPIQLKFGQELRIDRRGPPRAVVLKSMLDAIVCHEVRELIYQDGVRVFDPHSSEIPKLK